MLSLLMLVGIGVMLFYWWDGRRLAGWIEPFISRDAPPEAGADRPGVPRFVQCKVFFGNSERDPEGLWCDVVYPVTRRFPETEAVARSALEELLAGPTESELEAGYYSNINEGVQLLGVEIASGVATVNFSPEFDSGTAGACQVEAIRAQIRETLTQFQTVHEVRILVNGRSVGVLQP